MDNGTPPREAKSVGIPPVAAAAAVAIAINVVDTPSTTEPTKRKYVPNVNARRKKKLRRQRKKSSYDYSAAKGTLGLPNTARSQEVLHTTANPESTAPGRLQKSPPKAEVKRQLAKEKNSLRKAEARIDQLQDVVSSKKKDVNSHRKLVKTQQK